MKNSAKPKRGRGTAKSSKVKMLGRAITALENDLRHLAELNRVIFPVIVGSAGLPGDVLVARFDSAAPKSSELLHLPAQGDFYFARRIDNSIYLVVGDATGHHAHAGGLKLYMATMLTRLFEKCEREKTLLSPTKILKQVDAWFSIATQSPTEDLGGAQLVLIRIDMAAPSSIRFASAGLPVYALGPDLDEYGAFNEFNRVQFRPAGEQAKSKRQVGEIAARKACFLVVATDGFHGLKRRVRAARRGRGKSGGDESFGLRGVKRALRRGYKAAAAGSAAVCPAERIADALTESAKRFREGGPPKDYDDDHRLVVVVDLGAVWRMAETEAEAAALVPVPDALRIGAGRASQAAENVGALTKCIP